MAQLTPRFSTNRVVREYTETYYLPAATAYRARVADRGGLGTQLVTWQQALAAHWPEARFGGMSAEIRGVERRVTVQVHLGGLDPEMVCVELYAARATTASRNVTPWCGAGNSTNPATATSTA